jgi:hypothetical protein
MNLKFLPKPDLQAKNFLRTLAPPVLLQYNETRPTPCELSSNASTSFSAMRTAS